MDATRKIDLRPYLAAAIARNDRAYARGRMLYYDHPAECEAAALKSGCKHHRAITSCRTEYELKARQMLGVLCQYEESDITSILAHGWRQLYSAIKADKPVKMDQYTHEDNDATDVLFVGAYFCTVLGKPFPAHLQPVVSSLAETYEQDPGEAYVSQADKMTGKSWYPSRGTGTAALDDAPDQDSGEPFEMLAHMMGIGLSDYLYGIYLTAEQKGICALAANGRQELARPMGYFAMLINAIKADRRYMLDAHSERLIIDAKTAQIEAAKARREAAGASDQLSLANATIADLQRKIDLLENDRRKLTEELAGHEGDTQELAALRSALYAAESADEEPVAADIVPALPAGLKIIVMGGHQRWIAQMLQALPGLTYVPAGAGCDDQLIRNADAVWFRADYMSHTAYTPTIAICRAEHIPVYYFSGRGADRCVAELCMTMQKED